MHFKEYETFYSADLYMLYIIRITNIIDLLNFIQIRLEGRTI